MRRFDVIEVDIAKLRDYCLSDTHPRGRHKARVFRSRLGLIGTDAAFLRQVLLSGASDPGAIVHPARADEYGHHYILDVEVTTAVGTAIVRSMWIVRAADNILRLTSCYVL